jgi:hypothetical protein
MDPTIHRQLIELLSQIEQSIALATNILANTSEDDGTQYGWAEACLEYLDDAKSALEAKLDNKEKSMTPVAVDSGGKSMTPVPVDSLQGDSRRATANWEQPWENQRIGDGLGRGWQSNCHQRGLSMRSRTMYVSTNREIQRDVIRVEPKDRLPNLSDDVVPNLMHNVPRYFCPHCTEYSVFEIRRPEPSPFTIEMSVLFNQSITKQESDGWQSTDFLCRVCARPVLP